MAAAEPATVQDEQTVSDGGRGPAEASASLRRLDALDENLMSFERLDRASPELWPEQSKDGLIPGLGQLRAAAQRGQSNASESQQPEPLTQEDLQLMHQLGTLTTSCMIIEVKKLHDLAYKLGVEEAKEMTRGKYLNIFKSRRQR